MFLDVCLTGRPHTRYRSRTRGRGGHRVRGPPCAGFAGRRLVPLTCPVTCAGGAGGAGALSNRGERPDVGVALGRRSP